MSVWMQRIFVFILIFCITFGIATVINSRMGDKHEQHKRNNSYWLMNQTQPASKGQIAVYSLTITFFVWLLVCSIAEVGNEHSKYDGRKHGKRKKSVL
jgi:hypothetical protein